MYVNTTSSRVLTCFYIAGVLSCIISGYSMTSYNIHWIRQKPGKGLEWTGRMNTGSGTDVIYADSLKGQFTLTEDVAINTQFLEVKSLRSEDSAVYYCAAGLELRSGDLHV
uniref:Ig-like domain-containing protein n=1 Tax=Salmo trutta TaxID=8032 RepID=A0A674EIP3_SALTR